MSDTDRPTWQDYAACDGVDPDLFFDTAATGPGGGPSPTTKEALRICAACPVREACLEHALSRPETFGVWGGATERRRRSMRAARRRARSAS